MLKRSDKSATCSLRQQKRRAKDLTLDEFAARLFDLVPERKFAEIERLAGIKDDPASNFRKSVATFHWQFYLDNQHSHAAKANPAALHKLLAEAAERSDELAEIALKIWQAQDPSVCARLLDFVRIEMPGLEQMHSSGIGLIGVLEEFSKHTRKLHDPTKTGRPKAVAFDHLLDRLTELFLAARKDGAENSTDYEHFMRAASVDILDLIQAPLGLKNAWPNDEKGIGFRRRLRAINTARVARTQRANKNSP